VAFNFWEPENSLFPCFWCFRTFWIPNEPGKMHCHYFSGRKIVEKRTRREEPWGPNGHGPRSQGIWSRGAYLFAPWAPFWPPLLTTPSSHQKRGRPIFPEIYRDHSGGEASVPFQRGQILPLWSPGEGEIAAIFTTSPPWRRRRPLHHWYVSNVSIIFDALCLFLHHLLSVLLHFVAFLCIFRN
jgi:hypothetical protein